MNQRFANEDESDVDDDQVGLDVHEEILEVMAIILRELNDKDDCGAGMVDSMEIPKLFADKRRMTRTPVIELVKEYFR